MGRIGRLIQTTIEKFIVQTVETYTGVNLTAETFAPSGDDSPPLAEDRIVLVQVDGTGNFVSVGVLTESQGAKPGEKILFSRNEDGEIQAALKLLNDGKIEMISPADVQFNVKKNMQIAAEENLEASGKAVSVSAQDGMELKGSDVSVKGESSLTLTSAKTELTGGQVTCKGTATPSGQGPFCAIPACLFTGAPQCGTDVKGT